MTLCSMFLPFLLRPRHSRLLGAWDALDPPNTPSCSPLHSANAWLWKNTRMYIAMALSSRPSPMETLPPELLSEIFDCLDSPSYIAEHLEDDPSMIFTLQGDLKENRATPLEAASPVCRRWHQEVFFRLFRHLHLRFQAKEGANAANVQDLQLMLSRLSEYNRISKILSLTIFVKSPSLANKSPEKCFIRHSQSLDEHACPTASSTSQQSAEQPDSEIQIPSSQAVATVGVFPPFEV